MNRIGCVQDYLAGKRLRIGSRPFRDEMPSV